MISLFYNAIRKEAIPVRVFELCKLCEKYPNTQENIIKSMMEPDELNQDQASYFNYVKEAAQELKLIDNDLNLIVDASIVKDMNSMRKYCNSFLFHNTQGIFYKVSKCILDSNDTWMKFSNFTDSTALAYLRNNTDIGKVEEEHLRGTRFWLSYLGFIFIHEATKKITLIPNMYIALKDFIELSELEANKEYSVSEFIDSIKSMASVALGGTERRCLNLAMSNALRQMHDQGEIVLKRNPDSEEVWSLFENIEHLISDEITHIYINQKG